MIPSADTPAGAAVSTPTYNRGVLAVWTNRVITALSWIGVFIAGTLTYAHFAHMVPPCSSDEMGCAVVQTSKQSMFMDKIPVALLGLVAYLLLLAMAVIRSNAKDQWKTMAMRGLIISGFGTGYSAYLTYISFAEIGAKCQWCLASLATMTLVFVAHGVLVQAGEPSEVQPKTDWLTFGVAGLAAFGLAGMNISQMASVSSKLAKNINFKDTTEEAILGPSAQIQGNEDAKVTLVEFGDYNCGACRQAAVHVKKVYDQYQGKLRWAYRHMPLPDIKGHETSVLAARISMVAADQGKFWKYSEIVLDPANTEKVKSENGLFAIAQQAGVDITELNKRLKDPSDNLNDRVAADMDIGMNKLKATTTPTFILVAKGVAPVGVGSDQLEATLKNEPYASLLK